MMFEIHLHPLALEEMEESYLWYEERSEGLGNRFLAAIQKRFEIITSTPELYAKRKGQYREAMVDNFPFTVIYEILIKEKIIFVSYVFHTKRNPKLKFKR